MAIITVRVSPDAPAYVRGGHDPSNNTIQIDLDTLTEAERDLLARRLVADNGYMIRTARGHWPITVTAPTVEALLEAIRTEEAEIARRRVEEEAAMAAYLQALEGLSAADMAGESDWGILRIAQERAGDPKPPALTSEIVKKVFGNPPPWLRERLEKARKIEAERKAEEARRREEQEAQRRAAEAAALEALRRWAEAHGSERVKLLLDEQHKAWRKVAEAEYIASHTPAGFVPEQAIGETVGVRERTTPTVADIKALREARALVAGSEALRDAELCWLVVYRKATQEELEQGLADSDGDIVTGRHAAVSVAVVAPTGARQTVYRIIPQD